MTPKVGIMGAISPFDDQIPWIAFPVRRTITYRGALPPGETDGQVPRGAFPSETGDQNTVEERPFKGRVRDQTRLRASAPVVVSISSSSSRPAPLPGNAGLMPRLKQTSRSVRPLISFPVLACPQASTRSAPSSHREPVCRSPLAVDHLPALLPQTAFPQSPQRPKLCTAHHLPDATPTQPRRNPE